MDSPSAQVFVLRRHPNDQSIDVKIDANGIEDAFQGRIAFEHVHSLRLDRITATKYNEGHYLCKIETTDVKFFIRADFGDELECGRFRECMLYLHEMLAAKNPNVAYGSGVKSNAVFWLFNIGFILMIAGLEIAIAFGVNRKGNYLVGALFLIGLPVLGFLGLRWANGLIRPVKYTSNRIPKHLLPDGAKGKIDFLS